MSFNKVVQFSSFKKITTLTELKKTFNGERKKEKTEGRSRVNSCSTWAAGMHIS